MGKREQKSVEDRYIEVSNIFKKYNCQLLSEQIPDKPKWEREKIKFKCSCGKITHVTFRTFCNSHKCRSCTKKKIGDKFRVSYEDVKNFFDNVA